MMAPTKRGCNIFSLTFPVSSRALVLLFDADIDVSYRKGPQILVMCMDDSGVLNC